MVTECERNPELWKMPPCASKIRLAFLWEIIAEGDTLATEAESCVVLLTHAERRGVPLPPDLVPSVAHVTEAGAEHDGA